MLWTGASPHLWKSSVSEEPAYNQTSTVPFIEESSSTIKIVKVIKICLGSQECQRSYLKVAPEMAKIVGLSAIIGNPAHEAFRIILGNDMLRIFFHELLDCIPERRDGFRIFLDRHGPAYPGCYYSGLCRHYRIWYHTILQTPFAHDLERIVINVAWKLYVRFNSPNTKLDE